MFSEKMTMSDELFQRFSTLIYQQTGIFMKLEKRELLIARLGKPMRALCLDSFEQYYNYLQSGAGKEELTNFIDRVSTNFTSFFREKSHFDFLETVVLPEFSGKLTIMNRPLLLWSAACSTGEEPYTIAIVIEEFLEGRSNLHYTIHATDISSRVIAMAQDGVYSSEKVGHIPYPTLRKYFQKGTGRSTGYFKVKKQLQSKIHFLHFNLMQPFPWQQKLDVIFCRNVMIYFNKETQQELIKKFYEALAPGGYLFIGHSESLTCITHDFVQAETTTYRKM